MSRFAARLSAYKSKIAFFLAAKGGEAACRITGKQPGIVLSTMKENALGIGDSAAKRIQDLRGGFVGQHPLLGMAQEKEFGTPCADARRRGFYYAEMSF